jgi:putative NADPH-quinone reductase
MGKRITVIQGHPDSREDHLGHVLAEAYALAAEQAGHQLRHVIVAQLDFPLLRSKEDWETGAVPESIQAAQDAITWAEHLLIVHPLWLGDMPASFKAFWEQVLRPGFAIDAAARGWNKRLSGRSAHVVVTMGMPALVYRWFFCAHSLRSFVRNVLKFSGIGPVKTTVVGLVEAGHGRCAKKWLPRMRAYGAAAC